MKRVLIILSLVAFTSYTYGQARVMMNNAVRVVMDGGVFIVVDNPATNAITKLGTSNGTIVSEDEDNKVRWNIGTNTGSYTVPFGDDVASSGQEINLTMNITGAATGAGRVDFSTYETPNGAMGYENSPLPSMVTHLADANTATQDNSPYVADRFYMIDATNYTVKPAVDLTLRYVNTTDELANGNLLVEANLVAQRFDDGNGEWNGSPSNSGIYWGSGTLNAGTRTIGPFSVVPADFFTSWVLVDNTHILPVELLYFDANCNNGQAEITWSTATEIDNDYFAIEKSFDGINYFELAIVDGAGTSNSQIEYTYIDPSPFNPTTYYRLKQVDLNGTEKLFEYDILQGCEDNSMDINVFNVGDNEITIVVNTEKAGDYSVQITDLRGRQIMDKQQLLIQRGTNQYNFNVDNIAFGMYLITIENGIDRYSKKLIFK